MKNKCIKILFLTGVALISSCSKDFLDAEVDQYLTSDRRDELKDESVEAYVRTIEASVRGVYNTAVTSVSPDTGHDHFGIKAFHLATDLTGQDMVQTQHHWFGFDYNIENREAPYRRTRVMWRFFYRQIAAANIMLKDYFSTPSTSNLIKQKEAEVRGIRGIAYFYLVNLYQQTYKGNENALGVPLVLTPDDLNMPRVSVKKVYEQIVSDLSYAVENNIVTAVKTDVDKAVAAAYLAKAYAHLEDWANVEKYAKIASDAATFTSRGDVESGKWDISDSSWLWGYDITSETTGLYASFYSHIDNTINGYTGALGIYKSIDQQLYDKIADTDVRKKIFINEDKFPDIAEKYGDLPKYANIKYVTTGDFTGDYCFLRREDPYLLLVEAYVEQNKLAEAKTALEKFADERYDKDTYSITSLTSQNDLREEVRLQRRIELWGEGTSFFDFKRWNLGIDRTGSANHRTKKQVPAGDKRWVYQIPQVEVEANPNLGEQNP